MSDEGAIRVERDAVTSYQMTLWGTSHMFFPLAKMRVQLDYW
jgi:hypothetical protein